MIIGMFLKPSVKPGKGGAFNQVELKSIQKELS